MKSHLYVGENGDNAVSNLYIHDEINPPGLITISQTIFHDAAHKKSRPHKNDISWERNSSKSHSARTGRIAAIKRGELGNYLINFSCPPEYRGGRNLNHLFMYNLLRTWGSDGEEWHIIGEKMMKAQGSRKNSVNLTPCRKGDEMINAMFEAAFSQDDSGYFFL